MKKILFTIVLAALLFNCETPEKSQYNKNEIIFVVDMNSNEGKSEDDIAEFSNGSYASVSNFTNLGKHWSEMKGFALSLQFSPFSPFRDTAVAAVDLDDLKSVLTAMGDAPVLATDTQQAIDAYIQALSSARDTLQLAYGFDAENVAGW